MILYIDDDRVDQMSMRRALRQLGDPAELVVADDGESALEMLRADANGSTGSTAPHTPAPDLVLLDINMPRLDGHDVLAAIRRAEHLRHLPVVMLSTSSSPQDVLRAFRGGCNAYLSKRRDSQGMLEMVEGLIEHWFQLSELPKSH